jgi:catechol 2,3-dioxygenase-like lactoylglutathione lyase family enzyme
MGRYGFAVPPRLDHVVIAVLEWERSNAFYRDVLGVEVIELDLGRYAYRLPDGQQLNVHGPGATPNPRAADPVRPGNSDLCFVWDGAVADAAEHLRSHGVEVELGPVARRGARGLGTSVYFRDPDGSLLELIVYE